MYASTHARTELTGVVMVRGTEHMRQCTSVHALLECMTGPEAV